MPSTTPLSFSHLHCLATSGASLRNDWSQWRQICGSANAVTPSPNCAQNSALRHAFSNTSMSTFVTKAQIHVLWVTLAVSTPSSLSPPPNTAMPSRCYRSWTSRVNLNGGRNSSSSEIKIYAVCPSRSFPTLGLGSAQRSFRQGPSSMVVVYPKGIAQSLGSGGVQSKTVLGTGVGRMNLVKV